MDRPYHSPVQTFITEPYGTRKEQLIKNFNIRKVTAIGFSKDGQPLLGGKPAIIEIYDQKGELVESYSCVEGLPEERMTVSVDEKGFQNTIYIYDGLEFHTYDASQKLLERKTIDATGNIIQRARYEYENLSAGIETRLEYDIENKYVEKTVSKSDEQSDVLFMAFFDKNGEPNAKYTYEYDDTFRLIRSTEWGVITRCLRRQSNAQYLGLVYSDNRYEYDLKGNLIKKLRCGVDENINWNQSEFYRYDSSNRKIEEFGLDEYGKVTWKIMYEYNLSGNRVSRNYVDANGNIAHSRRWLYDEKGLVTELMIEDSVECLRNRYLFSYEYYSNPS